MFQFLQIFFKDIIAPATSYTQIACDVMCVQDVIQQVLNSLHFFL